MWRREALTIDGFIVLSAVESVGGQIAHGGEPPVPWGTRQAAAEGREELRGGTGSFGLKHRQTRGCGSAGQGKAPGTAAAQAWSGCLEKGCSLHLGGFRRVGTRVWGGGRSIGAARARGRKWLQEG